MSASAYVIADMAHAIGETVCAYRHPTAKRLNRHSGNGRAGVFSGEELSHDEVFIEEIVDDPRIHETLGMGVRIVERAYGTR